MSVVLPLARGLHAHRHRAAAVDGLGSHGGLLRVRGSLIAAAQVVSPWRRERAPQAVLTRPSPRTQPPLALCPWATMGGCRARVPGAPEAGVCSDAPRVTNPHLAAIAR